MTIFLAKIKLWVLNVKEYLNKRDAPKYLSGKKGNTDDTP